MNNVKLHGRLFFGFLSLMEKIVGSVTFIFLNNLEGRSSTNSGICVDISENVTCKGDFLSFIFT